VHLRPVLKSLPAYVPGRTVPGAVKLASNESPQPPLPHVLARIADAAADINRYPDNGATALTAVLAAKYGVSTEQVAVGCGSVSLCTQLVQAVADADDEVVYAWRSFEAYPILTAVSGASSIQVPLRDYVHDLDAMAEHITGKTRLIFVCNPNNPTGTAVGREALLRFLSRVPEDVVVALDEAYREYVRDPDVVDCTTLLDAHPNLIVLRTFSKAYGLAGLRVGYCLAAPEVAAAVRKCQVPFSVSGLAQESAIAALGDLEEVRRRAKLTVAERERVRGALVADGYDVPPSQANFVWLPLGDRSADFAAVCLDRGVVVRPFPGEGVRVTIGTDQENDKFLAVAHDLGADAAAHASA